MTDVALKIAKASEGNIGKRAEEYYYILVDNLFTTFGGNVPQDNIKNLETHAMAKAKRDAATQKRAAEKKTSSSAKSNNKDNKADANNTADTKAEDKKDKKKSAPDPNRPITLVTFTQTDFVQAMNAIRVMMINEINALEPNDLAEVSQITPTDIPKDMPISMRNYIIFLHKMSWIAKQVHDENTMVDLPQCATDFVLHVLTTGQFLAGDKLFLHNYEDAGYLKNRFMQDLAKFKQYEYIAYTVYEAYIYFIKMITAHITYRAWYQRVAMTRAVVCGELFSLGAEHHLMDNICVQFREKVVKKPSAAKKTDDTGDGDTPTPSADDDAADDDAE